MWPCLPSLPRGKETRLQLSHLRPTRGREAVSECCGPTCSRGRTPSKPSSISSPSPSPTSSCSSPWPSTPGSLALWSEVLLPGKCQHSQKNQQALVFCPHVLQANFNGFSKWKRQYFHLLTSCFPRYFLFGWKKTVMMEAEGGCHWDEGGLAAARVAMADVACLARMAMSTITSAMVGLVRRLLRLLRRLLMLLIPRQSSS